jgi:hypothetical protein
MDYSLQMPCPAARKSDGKKRWVSILLLRTSPSSLWIFFFFLVSAFVAEGLLQRFQGRRILAEGEQDESPA